MRLHFQRRPWDLYACIVYALAMAGFLLAMNVGNLFAILLVFFVPGYVTVAALFPAAGEIDWIERVALSVGVSLAVVPLLGLLLNFTALGISFTPIVGIVLVFTVLVCIAAYWRRMRLLEERRLSATLVIGLPDWKENGLLDSILTIALVGSIAVAAGTIAYVVTTPPPRERFTQFYILGPGGNASGYPTNLTPAEPGTVIVGIVNHESVSVNYTIRIDLVGVRIVYNATSGFNETVEVNRTMWSMFNVTLADGRNWTQPYTFRINAPGLWKVQFILFKDGDLSSAYQKLKLPVRVT